LAVTLSVSVSDPDASQSFTITLKERAFVTLGSQKNHMARHLMCCYGDPKLKAWLLVAESVEGCGQEVRHGWGLHAV
jgi:hypothetical protein